MEDAIIARLDAEITQLEEDAGEKVTHLPVDTFLLILTEEYHAARGVGNGAGKRCLRRLKQGRV